MTPKTADKEAGLLSTRQGHSVSFGIYREAKSIGWTCGSFGRRDTWKAQAVFCVNWRELQHDVVRWQAFLITRNLLDFRVSFKQRICKAEVKGAACGQILVQKLWHAVIHI